jgi:hypothetical protein
MPQYTKLIHIKIYQYSHNRHDTVTQNNSHYLVTYDKTYVHVACCYGNLKLRDEHKSQAYKALYTDYIEGQFYNRHRFYKHSWTAVFVQSVSDYKWALPRTLTPVTVFLITSRRHKFCWFSRLFR